MRHRSYHRTGSPEGVGDGRGQRVGRVGGEGREEERKRGRGVRGEGEAAAIGDVRVVIGAWEESEVKRAEET